VTGLATTIDAVSSVAGLSRREAVARTVRQRVLLVPDTPLRSRQVGLTVMNQALAGSGLRTGLAAYLRQQEQVSRWKEAADSRPVREVTVTGVPEDRGIGSHLDLRL